MKIDLSRLCQAANRSRLMLKPYRENHREMVRQILGSNYSDWGSEKTVPCNLLASYVSIVGKTLIPKNPRFDLQSFNKQARAQVSIGQEWTNCEVQEMELDRTLHRCVVDALISFSVCKVALAAPTDSARLGWNLDSGQPFAERVSKDDFVCDMYARDWSEVDYVGHRARVSLEMIRDSKLYSKARKDLVADPDRAYNEQGDEKTTIIGRGLYGNNSEQMEDKIDLWELYVPSHKMVYTFSGHDVSSGSEYAEPLRQQRWIGPYCGPYHFLGYGLAPDNLIPYGPLQSLVNLHLGANETMRKLLRSARDMKEVTAVMGGADEDGERLVKSYHGEMVRVDNPDKIKQILMGGPNQALQAFFVMVKDLFDFFGGNLSLIGGLAPQSKTATQDKMLEANASSQIRSMQDSTLDFVSKVGESLFWYWWNHPEKEMRVRHTVPGTDYALTRRLTPQQRQEVSWEDLKIKVNPYSMQHSTPQQRMGQIMQFLQSAYQPYAQQAQQQGIALDLNDLFRMAAEHFDWPELSELLTVQAPPAPPDESPGGASSPSSTSREYVRRSLGNDTAANREAGIMNMGAMGGNPEANGKPQMTGSVQ